MREITEASETYLSLKGKLMIQRSGDIAKEQVRAEGIQCVSEHVGPV